jgi:hypothetical protein
MAKETLAEIRARAEQNTRSCVEGGPIEFTTGDVPALLVEIDRLRATRVHEQEALEELLPCQFRFTNRDSDELNVLYSVGRLIETVAALEDALRRERARRP